MITTTGNIYLGLPLDRVRYDALHGVEPARAAWLLRAPDEAAQQLDQSIASGRGRDLGARQARIRAAAADCLRRNVRRGSYRPAGLAYAEVVR